MESIAPASPRIHVRATRSGSGNLTPTSSCPESGASLGGDSTASSSLSGSKRTSPEPATIPEPSAFDEAGPSAKRVAVAAPSQRSLELVVEQPSVQAILRKYLQLKVGEQYKSDIINGRAYQPQPIRVKIEAQIRTLESEVSRLYLSEIRANPLFSVHDKGMRIYERLVSEESRLQNGYKNLITKGFREARILSFDPRAAADLEQRVTLPRPEVKPPLTQPTTPMILNDNESRQAAAMQLIKTLDADPTEVLSGHAHHQARLLLDIPANPTAALRTENLERMRSRFGVGTRDRTDLNILNAYHKAKLKTINKLRRDEQPGDA